MYAWWRSVWPVLVVIGQVFLPPAQCQEKPAAARIPVVKTWKELQELPPIDLGDGVKIRVGIEATKVPQWSGALLYCLTEDIHRHPRVTGSCVLGRFTRLARSAMKCWQRDRPRW